MYNAMRLLAATALLGCVVTTSAETIQFNRDIRPILSENCFQCHGPDSNARQAGLRLDRREVAVSHGALKPGDAAASKLVARINESNEVLVMPPLASDKKLSARQKDILKRWIEQGAEYESHWAYIRPERPEALAGPDAIDDLLDKGFREKGVVPVDEAERVILARRLSFDLTGLPPRSEKTLLDHAGESLVAKSIERRVMRILPRGNWMDDSGPIVEPQAPHFLSPPETNERQLTRLDLADWVVDRDNPLTARVFVNRLWKMYFGTGLSKVLDDIGSQGETPRNQELLDWPAVEFMDSGWDVKHIVKTMLMSKAYRRSSEPSRALLAADPYNRLHGRQTMARLDAEFVRDNLPAVSGLLNRTMGGPSVKPYQPAGYYKELNFPKRIYEADLNPNQFRRGVYTHWQRQYVHPSLMAFDAPSREECAAERAVSNTPLQSLVLLNDPSYIEAARAFAGRILRAAKSDRGRVEWAFREVFSRRAQDEEAAVVPALLASRRGQFKKDPAGAEQLLRTGISEAAGGVKKTELAAWTSVARVLFNKHEFVMRY